MKLAVLATALLTSALTPIAFANTNAGAKLYVCTTPQGASDLARADFEALAWTLISGMGNMGETGSKTTIVNYDAWDTVVIQKGKGLTDAGSPTVECARLPTDPGQNILRAAGLPTNQFNYAFKLVKNDPAVIGGAPTIIYQRGIVTGPTHPNGKNEDFDLDVFTLGLNQVEIVVNPTLAGAAPALTVAPAVTGTAKVANVLSVDNGTFTGAGITYAYQWFVGGVAVPGAVANTYTPVVGDIGKIAMARVNATNISGNAVGFSGPTAAIIA